MARDKYLQAEKNEYKATIALVTVRNNLSAELEWIAPITHRRAHNIGKVCSLIKPNSNESLPPHLVGSKQKLKKVFQLSDIRAENALKAAHALRTGEDKFELHPMRNVLSVSGEIAEYITLQETARPRRK